MTKPLIRTLFLLILILIAGVVLPTSIQASVQSCGMNVSPTTTTRDTSTTFSFSGFASYSGSGVMWVRFTRPSANFTITSGLSTGAWTASTNGTQLTFTAPSQTDLPGNFTIYATSGGSDASSADWTVEMSDSGDGSAAAGCDGTLGVSISGSNSVTPTPTPTFTPTPDTTAPTISNVVVSGVSDSSVTITWNTNESANANINYGTTTSYGSSGSDTTRSTTHSLTLNNLSSNTTYHGQIQSTDAAGNTASSNDFTFATSQNTTTVTVTTTVTTIVTPTPTPTPVPDRTPPKVTLTTELNRVFLTAPVIEGTATDNKAIAKVEYSIDDGQNWTDADHIDTLGEKKTGFSFTPLTRGDGIYSIKVRAIDTNDNETETETQTIIIDRLPPAIGGAIFSIGPQILQPSPNGSIVTLAGLMPKLTFAAVGGPTSIKLMVNDQSVPMTQNIQTRLWSGSLVGAESVTYKLETESIDDAQNRTAKSLSPVIVLPDGTVSDVLGAVNGAEVRVYYFDSQAQDFRLWGAEQYGQENPQFTDAQGRYKLLLPAGTYYLQINASRTRPLRTNIFTLTTSTPIAQDFTVIKKKSFHFGLLNIPFPDFGQNDVMINLPEKSINEADTNFLVGESFPSFNLDGVQDDALLGKPTVVTVLTTWLPQSSGQMSILEELSHDQSVHTLVIMSQESTASVNVFAKRGGYSLPVVADSDGVLVTPLRVTTLPTHYFLDRKGEITKVVSGVLSKEQLEQYVQENL
ncbi:MAG: hypothetical protein ABI425_05010 [Patescibacteria group bacterium]